MKNNEYFSTSDFCLASTLLSIGYTLHSINKSEPQRASFLFTQKTEIEKQLPEFFSKNMKVIPQSFYNSQRELKNYLYQEEYHAS